MLLQVYHFNQAGGSFKRNKRNKKNEENKEILLSSSQYYFLMMFAVTNRDVFYKSDVTPSIVSQTYFQQKALKSIDLYDKSLQGITDMAMANNCNAAIKVKSERSIRLNLETTPDNVDSKNTESLKMITDNHQIYMTSKSTRPEEAMANLEAFKSQLSSQEGMELLKQMTQHKNTTIQHVDLLNQSIKGLDAKYPGFFDYLEVTNYSDILNKSVELMHTWQWLI